MPLNSYAQFLTNDFKVSVYDTVATIQTRELSDKSIQILEPSYSVYFDRERTIKSIESQIKELENQENIKHWQISAVGQIKRVKEYIRSQKIIIWEGFWNNESIPIDEIKDDGMLTKRYFWELACPMLETGHFELKTESGYQRSVLKTSSNIEGESATVFVTVEQTPFWVCPPITVD